MKQRLFWKILIGFWVTLLCMLQLVWGVYYLVWGESSSYEREVAQEQAPYQLALAKSEVQGRGALGFRLLQADPHLPALLRVSLMPDQIAAAESDPNTQRTTAVDPQGQAWVITLRLPEDVGRLGEDRWKLLGLYMPREWAAPTALGGLLFSSILAWYLTRPIRLLKAGFRSLANGNLTTRLQPEMGRRRDEIADLANHFDRMAERLQHLVLMRDRLLHDVSHELRSPLARLTLAVALVRQSDIPSELSLRRIEAEVDRLNGLVGELLSLARQEQGDLYIDTYFEIQELLDALAADVRFEAQAKNVDIVIVKSQARPLLIQGNAELIRRALENVIRNALQFSSSGQQIDVHVGTDQTPEPHVLVHIGDRGPGVPYAQLVHILDPFVRLPGQHKREGYGLGLSIAQRAIRSHGGSIVPKNRPGGGLLVEILLPLAKLNQEIVDATSS